MLFCFDTKKKVFIYLDLNLFSFYQICMYIMVELHIVPFLSSLCFRAIRAKFTALHGSRKKEHFPSSSLLVASKTAENVEWRIYQHIFIFRHLLHFSVSPTTTLSISLTFVLALVYYIITSTKVWKSWLIWYLFQKTISFDLLWSDYP